MVKQIPINPMIVEQLSKATIRTLVDGIVELVTNSDDSYRRLEERGREKNGRIEIYVDRKKGGLCEWLIVKDYAEGMTPEKLEKALEFASATSGFSEGKNVRGFFGRGLKETILALGEGEISTVADGQLSRTKIWYDPKAKKPQYDDDLLKNVQTSSLTDGTEVRIRVTNEKIKISDYESFRERLSKHYALRDINSSKKREIYLHFEDMKRKKIYEGLIVFAYPSGNRIVDGRLVSMPYYGDKIKVTVYESPVPLDSPRNTPYGLAGILIRTKGAILDNRLFKFENDPAALFFFGEATCEGLEERLRSGETELIDFNRSGLEWHNEYCQCLEKEIEKILEPLVLAKKKALEKKPEKELTEPTKRWLRSLCSLLNELAKKEFEDIEELPVEPGPDIQGLVLKPEWANVQKDRPRTLSVYAPTELVQSEGNAVKIESNNVDIKPLTEEVKLARHPKYAEELWYSYFKVIGKNEGVEGIVTATLGNSAPAIARIKVAPPKEKKRGKITGRKVGFISEIIPDETETPTQRTFYDKNTGIIRIFIKFPSVFGIIGSALEGAETPAGRILLAELVGEAFCRELARLKIESNPAPPGAEIDAFNAEMNKLQSKALLPIQKFVFSRKLVGSEA